MSAEPSRKPFQTKQYRTQVTTKLLANQNNNIAQSPSATTTLVTSTKLHSHIYIYIYTYINAVQTVSCKTSQCKRTHCQSL